MSLYNDRNIKPIDKLRQTLIDNDIAVHQDPMTKNWYAVPTKEQQNIFPFSLLSQEFLTESSCDINLKEMMSTILNIIKIKRETGKYLGGTTSRGIHKLIPFFEAAGVVKIDLDHWVNDKENIFRQQDKFCYRFINVLNDLYPDLEKKILSQQIIKISSRDAKIVDLCINLCKSKTISIEFDEKHHRQQKAKLISDREQRILLSRATTLMVFDFENDNFDDFMRAVCYEILRSCNNVPELIDFRNKFLVKFLAHNIGKINTDVTIGEQPIKMIINAIENGISISDMCIFLDNIMTEKEIVKRIKDMHFEQRDLIKENGKIIGVTGQGLLIFILMNQYDIFNSHKKWMILIIIEYIKINKGYYHMFNVMCDNNDYFNTNKKTYECYTERGYSDFSTPNTQSKKNRSTNENKSIKKNNHVKTALKPVTEIQQKKPKKSINYQDKINKIIGASDVFVYKQDESYLYASATLRRYLTQIKNKINRNFDQDNAYKKLVSLFGYDDNDSVKYIKFNRGKLTRETDESETDSDMLEGYENDPGDCIDLVDL